MDIVARHGIDAAVVSHSIFLLLQPNLLYGLKSANPNVICVMVADRLTPANLQSAIHFGLYDCVTSPVSGRDYNRICARSQVQTPSLSALVVEDDQRTRRHVMKTLGESSFNLSVSEAADLPLALSLCRSINYRYVFVDLDLPGLHRLQGAALLQREHKDCKVIPLASQQDRITSDQGAKRWDLQAFCKNRSIRLPLIACCIDHWAWKCPTCSLMMSNFNDPPDDNFMSWSEGVKRIRAG